MADNTTTSKPYLNPSPQQEREWQEQRLAALIETRQTVEQVLQLRSRLDRQRFIDAYRAQWGDLCAAALEDMVKVAWEKRRVGTV